MAAVRCASLAERDGPVIAVVRLEASAELLTFTSVRAAIDALVAVLVDAAKIDAEAPVVGIGRGDERSLVDQLAQVGHPGQMLISSAAARAVDLAGAEIVLLPLGVHRLRDATSVRRLTQVVHPDLQIAFPPPRTLDRLAHNLRPETTSFMGRYDDIDALAAALEVPSVLTLTGPAGVGKSRLAVQALAGIVDRWPDGVWRVELDNIGEGETAFADAVLRALGVADDHGQPPLQRIIDHLVGADALLFLDGCEGVVGAAAEIVDTIRARCSGMTILTTSREQLRVRGEVVRSIGPLDRDESFALFVDRATAARATFDSTTTGHLVYDICRRLDGIPLAIELAAARVRSMGPEAILSGLDDRFRLLTGGTARTVPRHTTMLASIEWSYALLSDRERTAFCRLAVLTGGWDLSAAERVVGGGTIDVVDVLELVSSLADKSLVSVDVVGRHRFIESVAHFALDRLVESGEANDARRAHLEHFAAMAQTLGAVVESSADPAAIDALAAEEPNLRAAIDWAAATDPVLGRTIAVSLTPYWILRGQYREATRALDGGSDDPAALVALGQVRLLAMDAGAAFGMLDSTRALELAEGDERTKARALAHLGFVESYLGMPSGADRLTAARETAMRTGDAWARLWALVGEFWAKGIARDDHTAAAPVLEELEAFGVEHHNAFLDVISDLGRGLRAARVHGNVREAIGRLERALEGCRSLGEPVMEMFSVCAYAEALTLAGDLELAATQLLISERRLVRSARGRADVVTVAQAALCDAAGEDDAAHEHVSAALPGVRAVGASDLVAAALVVLGRRDPRVLDEALDLARALPNARLEGDALACRGDHIGALSARWAAGLLPASVDSLEGLAVETLGVRRPADAVKVLAACASARAGNGWARRPRDHDAVMQGIDDLRFALGSEFEDAWEQGATFDLDVAVRVAARTRAIRRSAELGWGSLTPAETAVVELVASGSSNPEVATRLHMSRATVKTHLLHVYAKLGVANRVALATAWAERPRA